MSEIATGSDAAAVDADLEAAVRDAVVKFNSGDLDGALQICRDAASAHPEAPEPLFVLGVLALRIGDEGQAINLFESAHDMDPDCREYAEALANVCMQVGRLADGAYYAKIAHVLPSHPMLGELMPPRLKDLQRSMAEAKPSTHYVEAARLFNVRAFELALRECMAEIRLNSRHFDAYLLAARTATILGKRRQAVNALQAAIQLRPDSAMAAALLARALTHLGQFSDARAQAERALAMAQAEADAEVYGQAMTALQLCPDVGPEAVKRHAAAFAEAFAKAHDEEDVTAPPADAPLRIGFLSNVFHRAPSARLYLPWFLLRRKQAQWIGYQQSVSIDTTTTIIKRGITDWREVYDLDPFTLAYTIRGEELDVMVELQQPDADTRFGVLAMRPCRGRVATFGLPEPGLAPGITHVLSDEVLDEADRETLLDGQRLLTVKGSLFAEAPFRHLPQDTPLPAQERGHVTFAAMLDLARLTLDCALAWGDLLRRLPGARLMLIANEHLSDEVRNRAQDYLSYAGAADRLLFVLGVDDEAEVEPESELESQALNASGEENGASDAESAAEVAEFNALVPAKVWREVDIFLDTFPANTPFVPAEALWSGVPVVSLMTDRRPGRIGASVLNAAGRRNWIARSRDAYVDIAHDLAADLDGLAKERKALQDGVAASRLFAAADTAKQVAEMLRGLARDFRKG